MKHFIYTLTDPITQQIRYVGYSTNPEKRFKRHLRDKSKSHKVNWIQSLKKQGHKPLLTLLEECRADNWQEREKAWIAHYRKQGLPLTNGTSGGDGLCNPTQAVRDAISRAKKGKAARETFQHTPETKEAISRAKQGTTFSDTHKENLAKAHSLQWVVTYQGESLNVTNLKQFCLERGLDVGTMSKVAQGKQTHHKGYTVRKAA